MDPTADYPSPRDASPPCLPDFDLLRVIGEGGFGQVWLAKNQTTGQLRAVKVIRLHGSTGSLRAGREISSITRLESNLRQQHPNLLTIHHVGRTDEFLYYVMELADDLSGGPATEATDYEPATLYNRLLQGPLSSEECLSCTQQLLGALASLHQAGMVHRDVKPANCLFRDGQLRLADFGLVADAGPQVSRVGTERYMPPDGRMDHRADLFAAGLVIYEMISGMPVDRFPELGTMADEVTRDDNRCRLMRLSLWACQPRREDRPHSATGMLEELRKPRSPQEPAHSASWRKGLGAVAAALMVASGILAYTRWPVERVHVNFTSTPFEARILLDGKLQVNEAGVPVTTPCTIDDLPACPHRVTFDLPGHEPLDLGTVNFRETRQINARWPTE